MVQLRIKYLMPFVPAVDAWAATTLFPLEINDHL